MIFKQMENQKIEKKDYTITINNMECGNGHWNNEKYIEKLFANIYEELYNKDNINNTICKFAAKVIDNDRVDDIFFYREGDKIIILAISEVPNFHDTEAFSRYIEGSFKGQKEIFAINEITTAEYFKVSKGEIKIPESWILDEGLTNRFNVMKALL